MAIIVEHDKKQYLLTVSLPETDWIRELAKGMGITKEAIVAASMIKGLTYYVETFAQAETTSKMQDLAQDEIKPDDTDIKDDVADDKG